MFNADAFKASAVHEVNADRYTPLPVGEYIVRFTKGEITAGEKDGRPWARYDLTFETTDPATREERTVNSGFMLDLDDNEALDVRPNRNITLGQLRTAIGKNQKGVPFNWHDVEGCQARVYIKHRSTDKEDPTKLREQMSGFRPAHG